MKSADIIDTCDVWAEGVASILTTVGFTTEISSPWPDAGRIAITPGKVMLIARSLLPPDIMRPRRRNGKDGSFHMIVAVLHAGDHMSLQEFAASGLAGVLLSTASREAVLDCLRSVLNHQRWIDPHFSAQFDLCFLEQLDWSCLSRRESEVAELAAQGFSNKHIANALNLTPGTVKIHVHHILGKLGVDGRAALIARSAVPQREAELS
jgi:DNA-binding CsgD family transcriptional regulator